MFLFIFLTCQILLAVFGLYLIISLITKTPFYPSSEKELEKAIIQSKIRLKNEINFIDIGSGDGRIALWGARKGWRSVGIEYNPFLSILSRFKNIFQKQKATFFNKNFYNHTYNKYNLVYMYIFPKYMDKIEKKLFRELPKGCIIISKVFEFTNKKPMLKLNNYNFYKT